MRMDGHLLHSRLCVRKSEETSSKACNLIYSKRCVVTCFTHPEWAKLAQ